MPSITNYLAFKPTVSHLAKSRTEQCEFEKQRKDPTAYLAAKRRQLLTILPADARLHSRVYRSGNLRPYGPPDISRKPFTNGKVENTKKRRRACPDNAASYLQRSQLVSMWNTDCVNEDRRSGHGEVGLIMSDANEDTRFPGRSFQSVEVVGEKQKWVVPARHLGPSKVMREPGPVTATDLEADIENQDHMLFEDEDCKDQNKEDFESSSNGGRLEENTARKAMFSNNLQPEQPVSSPPSPPMTDGSDSSSGGDER